MTPRIWGYPQPGKAKSERLLVAFMAGAGGYIVDDGRLRIGDAAFYGTVGIEELFKRVRELRENGGDWYYMDNAYLDAARGRYFRISRNAVQGMRALPDRARLEQLGVEVRPWQTGGRQVVIVEQSEYFMRNIAGYHGGAAEWRRQVLKVLKACTDRPIVLRPWMADKTKASSTLAQDLAGAHCLIAHASAAANEALLAGVPAIVTGQCVASSLAVARVEDVEALWRPEGREEWAARLAASQWTLEEMRDGTAWRALQETEEVTQ